MPLKDVFQKNEQAWLVEAKKDDQQSNRYVIRNWIKTASEEEGKKIENQKETAIYGYPHKTNH